MTSWVSKMVLIAAGLGASKFALAQNAILERVPDTEVSSSLLMRSLLPYPQVYLVPHVDTGQVFRLAAPGASGILLAAVEYGDEHTQPMSQCGIYFLPKAGKQTFVSTIGPDETALCEGTSAIALMTDTGPHPRLIVLSLTLSDHGDRYTVPSILGWNLKESAYQLDKSASGWLLDQAVFLDTIAKVRHLLTLYDKSKAQPGHK